MPSPVTFVALFIIPACLNSMASFFNLIHPASTMTRAILIGLAFAVIEYSTKIPIVQYGHNCNLSPTAMQIIWIVLTLIISMIVTHVVAKKIKE